MGLSDGKDEAATRIEAALHKIFEQTINPLLRRAVELAESANARAEAAEARCAAIEQLVQSKLHGLSEFELKRLDEIINRSLDKLRPTIDRSVKLMQETVLKNTKLAEGFFALHDENVQLKSASISSIGKSS